MGFKDQQKTHWDRVAAGWETWAAWTDRNFRPITDWLVDALALQEGQRVLDVACGAGYPALSLAPRVGSSGRVVALDVSNGMTEIVARRSRSIGLDNVVTREGDAEGLPFADRSFDAAINTYGLMFCEDPGLAIREALRVLEPGGRLAVVVWDNRSLSPFFTAIGDVAASLLALPPPPAGGPGPWRYAPAGSLDALLADNRCADVRIESRVMTCEFTSVDEYVRLFADVAWRPRMETLTPEAFAEFRNGVAKVTAPYVVDGRLRLAAASRCASARKPS